jgi:hypothetical protein
MLAFIINTLLCTIKILMYSWFTNNQIFFKVVVILSLLSLLTFLYYPKDLGNDIEVIATRYRIHNNHEKIFTFCMILLYFAIFVGGIFYLRYRNKDNTVELKPIFIKVYQALLDNTLYVNIIFIILTYIAILIKIVNFFKVYIVKMHLFYQLYEDPKYTAQENSYYDNWYQYYIENKFMRDYGFNYLISTLGCKFPILYTKIGKYSIKYYIYIIMEKIHYIILLLILVYDIFFNNAILYHVYGIFPYIFIYDVYLKFNAFYNNLDMQYSADRTAAKYIYVQKLIILNDEEVYLDGDLYEIKPLVDVMVIYVKHNLNGKLFNEIREKKYYYKN